MNIADPNEPTHVDHAGIAILGATLANKAELQHEWIRMFVESITEEDPNRLREIAAEMNQTIQTETKDKQKTLLICCLPVLSRSPPEAFDLPTNPLPMILQHLDPNELSTHWKAYSETLGLTALHWVCKLSHPEMEQVNQNQIRMARILLDHGANVNARAENNLHCATPLHMACHGLHASNLQLIKLLLDHGADPNATNYLNETPLMHCLSAAASAASFILDYCEDGRIDISIVNSSGMTVYDMTKTVCTTLPFGILMQMDDPEFVRYARRLLTNLQNLKTDLEEKGAVSS